eukprot:15467686-Alexandrium_andersonii.AAC.1
MPSTRHAAMITGPRASVRRARTARTTQRGHNPQGPPIASQQSTGVTPPARPQTMSLPDASSTPAGL